MKKILFLIHALNMGGAQRVLVDLVNKLDPEKFDVTIQTIFPRYALVKEIRPGIRVKSIIRTRQPFISKVKAFLIRRVLPLKWTYNHWIKDDYDCEVAFLEGDVTRILAYSTEKNAKKYAWVHTDMMLNFSSQGLYKSVEEHGEVYQKYDKIVCVSQSAKEAFYQRFGFDDNVIVKYNVSNESQIIHKSKELVNDYMAGAGVCFVIVGNLRPEKRHIMLLDVLRKLKNEGYHFVLNIVGDGTERQAIAQRIKQCELNDCVKMLGMKPNPYPYINQADALIISSSAEGYSMVAGEACLLGVPVIATDCSGPREVLENGKFGILVPNNEDGLYKGLKAVLDNPAILGNYRNILNQMDSQMANNLKEIEKLLSE